MAKRDEIKQQNLEKILAAAEALFSEKGFEAATMNDIAVRSGVSKVSIYKHFASKDDIAVAIARGLFGQLDEFYRQTYFGEDFRQKSGIEQVSAVLMLFTDATERDASYYFLMMDFTAYMHRRSASVRELEQPARDVADLLDGATKPFFTAAIRRGRADGTIRPGMEPDELFFLMSSALRGIYQQYFMHNLPTDGEHIELLRERLRTLARLFIDALRAN